MTTTAVIDVATFRTAIGAAIRAPSVYNAQPWRFALRDGDIDVRIDPYRQLPVADPHQWAARIACGATITNIRLSLACAGVETRVRLWPDPADPYLVATISAAGVCTASPRQRALHAAIEHRHSNRRPFFDAPVPIDVRTRLLAAIDGTTAWLELTSEPEPVSRIAEIVRAADQRLRHNAAYIAEMNAWLARAHVDNTGIPPDAAGVAPAGQDLLALRDYGGRQRAEGRDFESQPLLAVLGTHGGDRYDDVTAGIALQQVLLAATDAGLATSMLSQPIEIPELRDDLRTSVHHYGTAQMIIRIGYGQFVGVSSRRPIDSVIDVPA